MSRKIVLALIIFVVIIGGALLITQLKSQSLSYKNQQIEAEIQTQKLYKDSDNDGLKDWEEGLWNTDPNNPDTNKDGINDAEAIRMGINPIGKGVNDRLATDTLQSKVNPSIEADLNETDKFSRQLLVRYLAELRDGTYATTTNYEEFFAETVDNAPGTTTKIYSESDFKKITETDSSLRTYGNSVGKIFLDKAKQYPGSEVVIFDEVADKNDLSALDKLDIPIKRYNSMRDSLLLVSVPEGLITIHTKMVNLLGLTASGIEGMRDTFNDPIKGMGKASLYPNAIGYFVNAFFELQTYFKNKGIIFKSNEPGYDFNI